MGSTKNKENYTFYVYSSLFWITISWGLFLLALSGIFYWWTTSLFIAILAAGGARFILRSLTQISKSFLLINILIIFIATVFVFFSTPTIFSGRDQGSISQAAIRLAQTGKVKFSNSVSNDFFNINIVQKDNFKNCLIDNLNDFQNNNSLKSKIYSIYCQAKTSSKAFNFPGFYYTADGNLVTQFPIVYIAWLALFYSFLGLIGFQIANGILIYFSLLTLYLLVYRLSNFENKSIKIKIFSQISTILILTSTFCFMWFSKFTLTENIANPLLWTGVLSTIILTESKIKKLNERKILPLLLFASLGLLIFTRIEGIAFFILAITLLLLNNKTSAYFKKHFIKIMFPALVFICIIFIWNLNVDIYFYKSVAKATLDNLTENSSDVTKNNSLLTILTLFKFFGIYGILAPILIGVWGIFYLTKTKQYFKLIPLAIVFPSLFYILSPQITFEHPWMLRRFTFSVLPLFILYSLILINKYYRDKKIFLGIFLTLIIIASNMPAFVKYLTFIPNENLFQETQKISQNFSNKDLVLLDQLSSGNSFEMIADPLNSIFGKNAVYLFNVADLMRIDKTKYEKIYLIIPKSKESYYQETYLKNKMFFVQNYSIKFNTLQLNKDNPRLPNKETKTTEGIIFEIIP